MTFRTVAEHPQARRTNLEMDIFRLLGEEFRRVRVCVERPDLNPASYARNALDPDPARLTVMTLLTA